MPNNPKPENALTTIRISKRLRNAIASIGSKDDSFETILWAVLKELPPDAQLHNKKLDS